MRPVTVCIVLALLAAGCSSQAAESPTTEDLSTSTTQEALTPTTTSMPATTTTQEPHLLGLYRVDAATLAPIPDAEPLTTGDWIGGVLSPNGEWLALQVWIDTGPGANLVQLVETSSGEIVAEVPGGLGDFVGVSDDGAVYTVHWFPRRQLHRLVPGGQRLENVSNDTPRDFHPWALPALVDSQRAGWLGQLGVDQPTTAVMVVDLVSGEPATHVLQHVMLGEVGSQDVGDWSLSEMVEPVVVWDGPRNRALIVHGDENKVTILDLDSGGTVTHDWAVPTSWVDRIFAWLIPPVQAKGPDGYGVTRSAILDPSGERLYVGSSISEVVIAGDEEWSIETTPQGVLAISTETWEVTDRWDIPASEVILSPEGNHLVATGMALFETLSTIGGREKHVFVIDTESGEEVGRFDPPDFWIDVQFSPDGRYLYIGAQYTGGRIDIVELATMEVVGTHRASGRDSLWGEALLASAWR